MANKLGLLAWLSDVFLFHIQPRRYELVLVGKVQLCRPRFALKSLLDLGEQVVGYPLNLVLCPVPLLLLVPAAWEILADDCHPEVVWSQIRHGLTDQVGVKLPDDGRSA